MNREKLTLRLEGDLIEKAKRVAGERNTSVSRMVASFFENLESSQPSAERHGRISGRLRGSIKPVKDKSQVSNDDYLRYLEEKHG